VRSSSVTTPAIASTRFSQLISQESQSGNSEFPAFPAGSMSGIIAVGIVEHVAGPVALGNLVADGAIGITLEPLTGDPARNYLTHECFTTFHAGKMSIALDLKKNSDYAKILRQAQVIIDNRSKRARTEDAVLNEFLNDPAKAYRVVYCHISGFGGKDESLPGNDVTVQAASGFAYVNGAGKNQPLKVGTSILDFVAADWAVIAIQSALMKILRNIPVENEKNNVIPIHITLAGSAARMLPTQYLLAKYGKSFPQRIDNVDNFISIFSFFKTKDNLFISIGTLTDVSFKNFCDNIIMLPELAIKFPTNKIRLVNNNFIHTKINEIIESKSRAYWLEKLAATTIPFSKVNSVIDAVKEPFANNLFSETNDKTLVVVRPDGHNPALDGAPKLNQHGKVISDLLKRVEQEEAKPAAPSIHAFYKPKPLITTDRENQKKTMCKL
jgi:crotonobetainyl-CoA:carnitine CoA-transferase CaiB-like acyl-CoA transferase